MALEGRAKFVRSAEMAARRSDRHLRQAAVNRSSSSEFRRSLDIHRRRAERTPHAAPSSLELPKQPAAASQEQMMDEMMGDYVAVTDILNQSVKESVAARKGMAVVLALMALSFVLVSEYLLPKFEGKPQLVDFMQVSAYGKTPAIIEEVVGVAFATSAFCNLLLFLVEIHPGKKLQSLMAVYVASISAMTAYQHCNGKAPIFTGECWGQLYNPMRYLMWAFTTPVMVMMVYFFSDFERTFGLKAAVADFVMIIFGFIGEVARDCRVSFLAYAVSYASFVITMKMLLEMFSSALENNQHRSMRVLNTARIFSIVCWLAFPALLLVRQWFPSMLDLATYEMFNTIVHYFSKIVFTNLLVHDFCLSLTERNALIMRKNQMNTQQYVVTKLEELVSSQDTMLTRAAEALRDPMHCVATVGKDLLAEIPQGVTSFFSMQLSTVVVNTQRLELITSSLLDRSAMMGDKKLQLKAQPIALWPVVQSTVRLFSNMAMPGVKIEAKVPSSLPAVHADEHRVAQVLGNLLSNAFKATRHGSVVVMAVTKGAFLEVSVKDTGPGMSKTTMRNLFNPLSSGQEEQRESGGMGLGLNLSHDLVQAHGGALSVHSTLGEGSTLSFTLPMAAAGAEPTNVAGVVDDPSVVDLRINPALLPVVPERTNNLEKPNPPTPNSLQYSLPPSSELQDSLRMSGMSGASTTSAASMRIPIANTSLVIQSISEAVEATLTRQLSGIVPELEHAVANSSNHTLQALRGPLVEQLQKQLQVVETMAKTMEMKLFETKTELLANSNVSNETLSHKMMSMATSLSADIKLLKEQMAVKLEGITHEFAAASPSGSMTPVSLPHVASYSSLASRSHSKLAPERTSSADSAMMGGDYSFDPKKIYTLGEFLQVIGLTRYLTTLQSQDINVDVLVTLDDAALKRLGVDSLGARLRFIQASKAFIQANTNY